MTQNPFPTFYQEFIYKSRYARWIEEKGRRENWDETINRYLDFFDKKIQNDYPSGHSAYVKIRPELFKNIYELKVMPSMRALMTAGKALERDEVSGYNCAFLTIDNVRAFDEVMYIMCCGTGVGFSVERQYVSKLPNISEEFHDTDTLIVVHDSKIGWAKAFRELLSLLYAGQVPKVDYSKIRPAGARLKTFGGRASGPAPLLDLFEFCIKTFRNSAGRRLTSLECHDIVCKIGEIVVAGGVRRSALISLSNLSDDRMRGAKMGQWWLDNNQRQLANNSAVYDEKPEFSVFLKEWLSLYESKAGERGIFSRSAAQKQAAKNGRRNAELVVGTNPCSEILLRPTEFCNLTSALVRPDDTLESLKEKVEIATILGTIQATLTNFRYLRKSWKDNCEEERLLGVSLSGVLDTDMLANNPEIQVALKDHTIKVNKKWAAILGINPATAITCVKPDGNTSQMNDTSPGLHARFSEYYIRTVRTDKKDPLALFMLSKGFPCEEAMGKPEVLVFSFPIKSPKHAVLVKNITAMEQLKVWQILQDNWCEHKPSCTIYYKDSEFLEVGSWVYNNLDKISGISFLPHTDNIYKQAPYQEITKEQYDDWLTKMPADVNWEELAEFEKEEGNTGVRDFACVSGACEIVDLVTS